MALSKEILLLGHAACGALGTLAAGWVLVESFVTRRATQRMAVFAALSAALIVLATAMGGWWYVVEYAEVKALVKAGPWPWAHAWVMETKEHVFLMLPLLAILLPLTVRAAMGTDADTGGRLIRAVAGSIVLLGLAMEGMGAIVSMSVRLGMAAQGGGN